MQSLAAQARTRGERRIGCVIPKWKPVPLLDRKEYADAP
jgi:hypothetical protein